MNKHTKVAILIAPVLMILGYAATDMYSEEQAAEKRIFELQVKDQTCDIKAEKCILQAEEFLLSISHKEGETIVNSTYPLDTATFFIVGQDKEATSFPLGMSSSPYYWRAKTNLAQLIEAPGATQKLRIIANIKGGAYISEFTTQTD